MRNVVTQTDDSRRTGVPSPLPGLGAFDLLAADPRPSFVVTLSRSDVPSVAYINPALEARGPLLDVIRAPTEENTELWDWILQKQPATLLYAASQWTRFRIQEDTVVVGANEQSPSLEASREVRSESEAKDERPSSPPQTARKRLSLLVHSPESSEFFPHLQSPFVRSPVEDSEAEAGALQPNADDPSKVLPEIFPEDRSFIEGVYNLDWASTPLGHIENWPDALQRSFTQIIADSMPIAIYWGPNHTTLYNEALSKLCGLKHPHMLGKPVEETWPELGSSLKETMMDMKAVPAKGEWTFFVEKGSDVLGEPGWGEETHLQWSLVPIHENNTCVGFQQSLVDNTSTRLWERRMKMLVELGDLLVTSHDIHSYWLMTMLGLEKAEPKYDIPLAVLFSVEEDYDTPSEARSCYGPAKTCKLAGSLGAPEGHPIAPQQLKLRTDDGPLAKILSQAIGRDTTKLRLPFLVQTIDGSLPDSLLENIQWRGFDVPCRAAVVCPIMPTKDEDVMGLLLLGLNPRRPLPLDNDYLQYILLLSQKLTTSLASTVLLEEEGRRGRNAAAQAAYDRAVLQQQLAHQTSQAAEWSQKFKAVAESIPVGMCFGDHRGDITFANDTWCKIIGCPQTQHVSMDGFLACVRKEDRAQILKAYQEVKEKTCVEFEFRVKRSEASRLKSPNTINQSSPSYEIASLDLVGKEEVTERHVVATAKAERGIDGSTWILTCLTDVTLHKRVAEEAIHRAQQAENLKRMAELAVVGMCDMHVDGRLQSANKVFFEMCGLGEVDPASVDVRPFESCLHEEDVSVFEENVQRMVHERLQQHLDVRLKTIWTADDGSGHEISGPQWVELSILPIMSTDGEVTSYNGCLADISMQKWQLQREKERKEEAIQAKQEQENFIDMTSHEMRNPLGAIMHCTESIIATLSRTQDLLSFMDAAEAKKKEGDETPEAVDTQEIHEWQDKIVELISDSMDNAETVISCSQHQKLIVDDILTLSKLDAKLLAVTPVTTSPVTLAKEVFKMFIVEARRVDTGLHMVIDDSFKSLGHEYLDLDPTRVKQVLINLITNALKFTRTGESRNVSLHISGSRVRPTDASAGVEFIPRGEQDDYEQPALAERGDPIYLIFEVKDTGKGLSEDEKKVLFRRFVQASSRTHVKYGGSGLGLYISRRLSELQRGAIGVSSQLGTGSTFAFYIESYVPSPEAKAEAERVAANAAKAQRANLPSTSRSRQRAGSAGSSTSVTKRPGSLLSVPADGLQMALHAIKSVMVVEDNLINQQITRRHLTNLGFSVVVANHGVECLELLTETDRWVGDDLASNDNSGAKVGDTAGSATSSTPKARDAKPLSIILMDVEMPQMDGLTCTRRIREYERTGRLATGHGRLPIIAVSANARLEQKEEALKAGCDDVMVKPYRMPDLVDRMRQLVANHSQPNSFCEPELDRVEEIP